MRQVLALAAGLLWSFSTLADPLHDIVLKGSVDRSVTVHIIDNVAGTDENAVVYNTSGIDLWYRREGAASVDLTEATLAALTTAHADGGFLFVNDGVYRVDLPDAAVATGANYVDFGGTVTGMIVLGGRVRLIDVNLEAALATPTNITAGTITTVTNLTNAPTAGDLTATMKTSVTTAVPTAAVTADAVWDEDATAHQTTGTFGQAIGDPVADTNTIYKAVVTDATGATVGVDVVAAKAESVLIVADTNEVQISLAAGGLIESLVDDIGTAGAGLTNIDLPNQTMDIAGTLTTVTTATTATNLTNAPTNGDLTATMKTSVTAALLDADMTAHQTTGTFGQAIGDPVADTKTMYAAVVTDATGASVGIDSASLLTQVGTAGAGLSAIPDQSINLTGNLTGNVTGSVGSVTGAVGSVTGAVGSVTASVTVGAVTDGTFVAADFGANFLNAAKIDPDVTTELQAGLATPTNITAGVITTVTNLTNAPTNGDLTATMKTSAQTAAAAAINADTGDTFTAIPDLDTLLADEGLIHCTVNTAFFAGSTTTLACILTDVAGGGLTAATNDLTGSQIRVLSGTQLGERRFFNASTWDGANSELQLTLTRALPATLADGVIVVIR